jgi:hypothetical protein
VTSISGTIWEVRKCAYKKISKSYLSNRLGLVHLGQLCFYVVVFLQKRLLLLHSHFGLLFLTFFIYFEVLKSWNDWGLERLTAKAKEATVLGSIPASSNTVASEGREIKYFYYIFTLETKWTNSVNSRLRILFQKIAMKLTETNDLMLRLTPVLASVY